MVSQHILLPYNFTPLDRKAVAFVIETYGHKEAVAITLLNLYTPMPEIDIDKLSVMANLQGNMTYLRQKITEQEEALGSVYHQLLEGGFEEQNVLVVFKPRKMDIAQEIIEMAKAKKFDVVVLNHKSGKVSRFFAGSVFSKLVTTLTDTTISIVT